MKVGSAKNLTDHAMQSKKECLKQWERMIEQAKCYKGDIHGIDLKLRTNFCQLLRETLSLYRLTQAGLARAIKKTPVTVNKWTKESSCPTYKTMIEIRNFLHYITTGEK